jgi:hypothetical protein
LTPERYIGLSTTRSLSSKKLRKMKAALRRQEKAKEEKRAFEMNAVMKDVVRYLARTHTHSSSAGLTLLRVDSTFKWAASLYETQGGHTIGTYEHTPDAAPRPPSTSTSAAADDNYPLPSSSHHQLPSFAHDLKSFDGADTSMPWHHHVDSAQPVPNEPM